MLTAWIDVADAATQAKRGWLFGSNAAPEMTPDEVRAEYIAAFDRGQAGVCWAVHVPAPEDKEVKSRAIAITGNGPTSEANAKFISWCSPGNVRLLIEEIRAMRRANRERFLLGESPPVTDRHHSLFFTRSGAGPDNVALWLEPVPSIAGGVFGRTIGLRVGPHESDEFGRLPLFFATAGGYQMDEATVDWLIAGLTAWKHAPRDAARAAAEVVHRDDTVEVALVKTSLGEWGVRLDVEAEEGGIRYETSWYTGDAAEVEARRHYNGERDVESCCYCSDEVDYGAAGVGGCEDGVLCPTCAEIAHEEWLASPVVCTGGFTARNENGAACGWRGKGADAAIVDGNSRLRECPTCGGEVELTEGDEEVDEAAVAALTGSM